jgi:hypothetical protein
VKLCEVRESRRAGELVDGGDALIRGATADGGGEDGEATGERWLESAGELCAPFVLDRRRTIVDRWCRRLPARMANY